MPMITPVVPTAAENILPFAAAVTYAAQCLRMEYLPANGAAPPEQSVTIPAVKLRQARIYDEFFVLQYLTVSAGSIEILPNTCV